MVVLLGTEVLAAAAGQFDWPQWQGPDRTAISKETGLLQQWPEGGPPLAWKPTGLGGGDSAPSPKRRQYWSCLRFGRLPRSR